MLPPWTMQREGVRKVSRKRGCPIQLPSDSGGPECSRNGAHRLRKCVLYSKNSSAHVAALSKHSVLMRIKYSSVGPCKQRKAESTTYIPGSTAEIPSGLK